VLISAKVAPEFREYERANTTVMSAYVAPRMDQYLGQLAGSLADGGFAGNFFMMQSNGGVIPPETVRDLAINTFLSGPAAGVIGASHLAGRNGAKSRLVTFDMGGTSTDVSLVDEGMAAMVPQIEIDGLPVRMPTIDITTVGAGGGSIAWVDRGGMLQVGPQSAGADPGPACYGRGGQQATVTDANVVLGIIRASQRIGTRITIDGEAAEAAVARVADVIGLDVLNTAEAIIKIADAHMIDAIRLVTTERGLDPRDHALVAFGGAGPLHAARLASALGMRRVIVPLNAGLVSAYGLVVAPLKRQVTMTAVRSLATMSEDDIRQRLRALEQGLLTEFVGRYGLAAEAIELTWELDLRYAGQGFELTLPVDQDKAHPSVVAERFHAAHERRYGHARLHDPVDAVTWRVTAQVHRTDVDVPLTQSPSKAAGEGTSRVYWDGRWVDAVFVTREGMAPGEVAHGPQVIEESTSATFVPPGWRAAIHSTGNLLLEEA
jgi:N-methylhydantoinase A